MQIDRLRRMQPENLLDAYGRTWLRTEKGPQLRWLKSIGNSDTDRCKYGDKQTGAHLTFHCYLWDGARSTLIGDRENLEDLDDPIWIQSGPDKDDIIEGGEEWFSTLHGLLATYNFTL